MIVPKKGKKNKIKRTCTHRDNLVRYLRRGLEEKLIAFPTSHRMLNLTLFIPVKYPVICQECKINDDCSISTTSRFLVSIYTLSNEIQQLVDLPLRHFLASVRYTYFIVSSYTSSTVGNFGAKNAQETKVY